MSKKVKKSPKGTAVFPHINRPDTRFDPEGKYSVDLRVDPNDKEVARWLSDMREMVTKQYGDDAKVPYVSDEDQIRVKFSSKFPPVQIVDADNNPTDEHIGGGSIIQVAYTEFLYDGFGGGLKLYLKAVKVYEAKGGADYFDDDEPNDDAPPF